MARRTTCTSHCAACGRHFAGDGAFDLHRRGEASSGRHCVAPLDEPRLAVADDGGRCSISGEHDDAGVPTALEPVTVYALAVNRTDAKRATYAALRAAGGKSSSATRHADQLPESSPVLARSGAENA